MSSVYTLNVSIVVVAEQHNPTILHPAFLAAQGIVPEAWEVGDGPVCTPAFAMVGFKNGISFRVDQTRLHVIDSSPAGDGSGSPIPELATKYVQTLPHVTHKAVGVNFIKFLPHSSPAEHLVATYLTSGAWNSPDFAPASLDVKLTYKFEEGDLGLTLKPGAAKLRPDQIKQQGIVIDGNFHTDTQTTHDVEAAIDKFYEKLEKASEVCNRILDIEGKE
jgi:hypothetical protein